MARRRRRCANARRLVSGVPNRLSSAVAAAAGRRPDRARDVARSTTCCGGSCAHPGRDPIAKGGTPIPRSPRAGDLEPVVCPSSELCDKYPKSHSPFVPRQGPSLDLNQSGKPPTPRLVSPVRQRPLRPARQFVARCRRAPELLGCPSEPGGACTRRTPAVDGWYDAAIARPFPRTHAALMQAGTAAPVRRLARAVSIGRACGAYPRRRQGQTRREPGTQSHGTGWPSDPSS